MGSKTIDTLVFDIESVLSDGIKDLPEEQWDKFANNIKNTLKESFSKREPKNTLRMSNIGKPCGRQLWYDVNAPEDGEVLRPETYMKFTFGHLLEELLLFLAEVAGHEVTGRQDESEIAGIKGHKDAVVDGTLVDVKSASTYSFQKFTKGLTVQEDSFGYLTQLGSYLDASQNDPNVVDKDRAAFLVVDKTLGHITLDVHSKSDVDFKKFFEQRKDMVIQPEPPERAFESVPQSKTSPNKKLGTNCSYCAFKKKCWPHARTFLYATGPVTLTEIHFEPNVPELK